MVIMFGVDTTGTTIWTVTTTTMIAATIVDLRAAPGF